MNTQRYKPVLLALAVAFFTAVLNPAQAAATDPYKLVTIHRKRVGYWDQKVIYAHFNGSTPIIRLANHVIWNDVKNSLKEPTDPNLQLKISDGSHEDPVEYNKEKPDRPYAFYYRSTVALITPTLISGYGIEIDDTGGHPSCFGYSPFNIGLKNGKPAALKLQDLFRPDVDSFATVAPLMMASLKANPWPNMIQSGEIKKITPDLAEDFILTRSGITFMIRQYSIAESGNTALRVKIPYSAFGDKLDPQGPLKGLI